jgi:hypothetical protein
VLGLISKLAALFFSQVSYLFSLPYTGAVQPVPLSYPVTVTFDSAKRRLRMSVLEGLDETLMLPEASYL